MVRAPVCGQSDRARVPNIAVSTVLSGSAADACLHRHPIVTAGCRSVLRTDLGRHGPRQASSCSPTVFVAGQRGVIMRRRKRSCPWPPARTGDAFPHAHGAETDADARTDTALRTLARLLARQAAREVFERTVTDVDADRSFDEGRE